MSGFPPETNDDHSKNVQSPASAIDTVRPSTQQYNDTNSVGTERTASPTLIIITATISTLLILLVIGFQYALPPYIAQNELTRQLSIAAVAIVAALLTFGIISGSSASFGYSSGKAISIGLGGAAAAFAAFFWLIGEKLTPTARLTVILETEAGRPLNDDVELVVDHNDARQVSRALGGRGEFNFLPRGEAIPIRVADGRFELKGGNGSDCSIEDRGGGTLRISTGCRMVTLTVGISPSAKFRSIGQYEAIISYGSNFSTSLSGEIDTLVSSLQRWVLTRDRNVSVTSDLSGIPEAARVSRFSVASINGGSASLCVHLGWIEQAYNSQFPNARIRISAKPTMIVVTRDQGESPHEDICKAPG